MPIFIGLMAICCPWTHAMIACAPKHALTSDMKTASLRALNVTNVGVSERKSALDYGLMPAHPMTLEAVEKRYAATGDISCDKPNGRVSFGQAQVTLKNNLITTIGHVTMSQGDCTQAIPIHKCVFTIRVDGKDQDYPLDSEVGSGYDCPATAQRKSEDDWAVFKLKKPVDRRVKPYGVRREKQLSLGKNEAVVSIGKSYEWPPGETTPYMARRPRHYGDCSTGSVTQSGKSGSVETDCDTDHGDSGGSLVTPGSDPVLLAIHRGGSVVGETKCDPETGKKGHDQYQEHCWASFATPVTGEFLETILRGAGEAIGSKTAPSINSKPPEGFRLPGVKL